MHHSESSADSPGTRIMAQVCVKTSRRDSNTGNCSAIPTDNHQSSLLNHHPPPAGSSSASPQHPSASTNIHAQSQSYQSAGVQTKKKSGFQITSVLPAQSSASTNNSIADDTESYDDMDESHTEDLSSSDVLDMSVSRATDTGIPDRSSSEETLNSLHGGETPGVLSPNEPVNPHLQSLQTGCIVNGTVHHHKHHSSGHHQDQEMALVVTPQKAAQRAFECSVSLNNNASSAGTTVQSVAAQQTSSVQAAAVDVNANGKGNQTLLAFGSATGVSGAAIQGIVTGANAIGGGLIGTTLPVGNSTTGITVTAVQVPSASSSIQACTAIASRFRVVKLDASLEPFRKGRWMCTEFYEKETSAVAPFTDAAPVYQAVESCVHSESENTSGGSSCSSMSATGDQAILPTQQIFVQPGVPVLHPSLSQTSACLETHSQDTEMHTVPSPPVAPSSSAHIVSVPSLLGAEGQTSPPRSRHQIPDIVEGYTDKLKSGYPINQQHSMLMNQGLQSVDYPQISKGIQAPTQSPQMLPVQNSITPRTTSISSFPVGTPTMTVPECVSPRPEDPVKQMVLAQGSTINQTQQHELQMHHEQQQQVTHHQGVQSPQLPLEKGAYRPFLLEDAGHLLLQHQSLLSLPRLAAGSMSGFVGQCGSEASGSFGQEGSAIGDGNAGTDEDR